MPYTTECWPGQGKWTHTVAFMLTLDCLSSGCVLYTSNWFSSLLCLGESDRLTGRSRLLVTVKCVKILNLPHWGLPVAPTTSVECVFLLLAAGMKAAVEEWGNGEQSGNSNQIQYINFYVIMNSMIITLVVSSMKPIEPGKLVECSQELRRPKEFGFGNSMDLAHW